ncbi:MAG: histidinol-phosphatase [Treponema sp.]|nr:histidinol-phosphatase [Treponema sp.]
MEDFIKTNYHTHSTFCDGKNTPEEMVLEAVKRGFSALGFSSHSMQPFASDWHMHYNAHGDYVREIARLKEAYSSQIEIYTGFEADYIEGVCCPSFERYRAFSPDYLIGAVHYVPCEHGFFGVDGDFVETRQKITELLGGDRKKAVQGYFSCEREMLKKGDFTILAHADLIRIQNSAKAPDKLFDEGESWYRDELRETAKAIASAGVCVEINTGAMARGKLDTPYPSQEFLSMLREYNVPLTLSSDAHRAENLDFGFEQAVQWAKKANFTELQCYVSGKIRSMKI